MFEPVLLPESLAPDKGIGPERDCRRIYHQTTSPGTGNVVIRYVYPRTKRTKGKDTHSSIRQDLQAPTKILLAVPHPGVDGSIGAEETPKPFIHFSLWNEEPVDLVALQRAYTDSLWKQILIFRLGQEIHISVPS